MRELLLAIFLVAVSSVVVASLAVMGIIGPCYWHEPNQAISRVRISIVAFGERF